MPSLTLKSISEPLYERLKRSAQLHRRSLNSEALTRLESVLMPREMDPEEFLSGLDALHAGARIPRVTDALLRRARREGRP
jgi:hypothetical protein